MSQLTPFVLDGSLATLIVFILILDGNWFALFASLMLVALGFVSIGV